MTSTYKIPTHICHMTHVNNLPSIISVGGLLSHTHIRENSIGYTDISLQSVQDKRSKRVPCAEGGTLHDYVPFYFHPKNPMQYTIMKGNVEQYKDGIQNLILLCTTAQAIEESGIPFAFTDRHAVLVLADFYTCLGDLSLLNWEILTADYWTNYVDGREVRQAEFLAHRKVPWSLVRFIGVHNELILQRVNDIIGLVEHKPVVKVKREWFF